MQVAVLGSGSWGTALALQLARAENQVRIWHRDRERAQEMQRQRENSRYLPGIPFGEAITVSADMDYVLNGADLVVFAIPSQHTRAVVRQSLPLLNPLVPICCASKGIERGSLMTMEEVFRDVLPRSFHAQLTFLAGPSFAKEVAMDMPTAVVVASRFSEVATEVADAFHAGNFRVYHTDDIVGAELGGALKNIIAIACGVVDGMEIGLNARAGLMTRGLAEISRLAVARGANPLTMAGLSGMGDLVLTCTGNLSRNRRVGLGLGQGKKLPQILRELGQVAEGVITTESAKALAQKEGIEAPLIEQVYMLLYEEKSAKDALRDILGRERRAERG
ncbi:MAG: NAD(P)H-dependent glycerol-3-phosphate dehydrogenase [Myxococcota bacterium]|nr:NAD(P)H-dependent glycerol-3-phosphate dehydrogenase [Myxococcota bacterium]